MAVFRVTDPAVLENPEIQAFVYRALAKNRFPPTTIGELAQRVRGDANLGVFIGHEGGKLGMAIAQLPTTHFALAPQVLLAYNEGPHSLTSAVIAAVKAWIEPTGWKKLIGCNRSGHPDAAWCRVFKPAGTPSLIGTAYEFNWG
jgi:hypothetical protein